MGWAVLLALQVSTAHILHYCKALSEANQRPGDTGRPNETFLKEILLNKRKGSKTWEEVKDEKCKQCRFLVSGGSSSWPEQIDEQRWQTLKVRKLRRWLRLGVPRRGEFPALSLRRENVREKTHQKICYSNFKLYATEMSRTCAFQFQV